MSYDKNMLEARRIKDDAVKLAVVSLISKEQLAGVFEAFKDLLYSPSVFLRIGLFVFTLILVNAAMGIFLMMFSDIFENEQSIGIFLILTSMALVWALEFFTGRKYHYRSGIDDCLLYSCIAFIVTGIVLVFSFYDLTQIGLVALPVLLIASWRYADAFISTLAFICFYIIVFLFLKEFGWGRIWMPFIYMGLSAILVAVFHFGLRNESMAYYFNCFRFLKVASLLTLYASMNYFVVREGNLLLNDTAGSLFHGNEIGNSADLVQVEIPLAWLFLALTMLLPMAYMFFGFKWKDRLVLRTGLLVLVLTVLTYKYKYDLMAYEYTMTWCGLFMLAGSWLAIRVLENNPMNYTFEADPTKPGQGLMNAEALLISQTLSQPIPEAKDGVEFGGGTFGGGGAGGNL